MTLYRESASEPWGFRLAGGKDYGQPLSISQVSKESLAAKVGLTEKDFLISIAGKEVFDMTHEEAEKTIMNAGNKFSMVIERVDETGRKISFEKSASTFQLKLKGTGGVSDIHKKDEAFISNVPITEETPMLIDGSVNFKKYEKKMADLSSSKTLEDVSKKANMKKDWNTPWVKKDGSGLKQAMRYVDEPNAPARTSVKHYYSEPKSILGNDKELTREELEAIIQEHGQESRPESRISQGSRPQSRAQKQQQMGGGMYQQETTMEMQDQEMRREDHQIQIQREQKSFQQTERKEQRVNFVADDQETYFREREEDSQAPPDLEPVEVQQGFQLGGMGQFGDEGYEPSADELIDVLKNLENLAAGNPSLYRSIVDQIKGSTQVVFEQSKQTSSAGFYQESTQHNGNTQQYEQEMYEQQLYQQQQQEAEMYQMQLEQQQQQMHMQQQMQQQMYEEQSMMTQQTTMTQETTMSQQQIAQQQAISQKQQQQQAEEQMAKMSMSEDEFKQHQKMKRLEAEAQEEVRQTLAKQREAKMRKLHPPEPPKPKEIMVIAGDGKPVKVQLGGEPVQDSRKQVAEAAGLKHVPLPDFDGTENSAWSGSLKKTSKAKVNQGRQEVIDDENPWAGSLRHVNDKPRKGQKKESDDLYGGAPWMGTLRHVVHDNKVTRNYGVNKHQSKRYPDEDAGNPFEATQGCNARPAFPLTPAAIVNGNVMTRDEMARREEDEEVARIRKNIGSSTVSTALLQVLMPKLLKMHETKYSPMEKADAEKIMSEILGMQCGLNPDQQADANEEAEMIIRAIMQDEVDKSIYSKMADDLEAASKRMKKMKKNKVKKVTETGAEITA